MRATGGVITTFGGTDGYTMYPQATVLTADHCGAADACSRVASGQCKKALSTTKDLLLLQSSTAVIGASSPQHVLTSSHLTVPRAESTVLLIDTRVSPEQHVMHKTCLSCRLSILVL